MLRHHPLITILVASADHHLEDVVDDVMIFGATIDQIEFTKESNDWESK